MALNRQDASALLDQTRRTPSTPELPAAHQKVDDVCREAQNAIRAAITSCQDAVNAGSLLNRIQKVSAGTDTRGKWSSQAQDSLRAALLFAGAGFDRSLKLLVKTTLPKLLSVGDEQVKSEFEKFAAREITDQETKSVSPEKFVQLLLSEGSTPREIVVNQWINVLTEGSAQSVDRACEISSALGVTDPSIRKRFPVNRKSQLKTAFVARNEIIHELDISDPEGDTRKRLERIRRERTLDEVEEGAYAMLNIAQLIVNDVVERVAS